MEKTLRNKVTCLLLSSLLVWTGGCADLTEKPDFINPDSFYQSSKELQLGVNGIYDDLTKGTSGFDHFYNRYVFECLVGYQIGWEKGPLQYNLGNINPADEYIEAYWQANYRSIDRANNIIEIADKVQDPANVELTKRLKAEAQFLRAYYYFSLARYFDNVPLKTTATKSYNDLPSNEGGMRAVIDQIYADCEAAAAVLPATYPAADAGRATKWAAKTLLLKAQLLDEKWAEAKATSEDIIQNSGLTLFADFSHNFAVAYENKGERIFEGQVSFKANNNENVGHSAHFNPEDYPSQLGGSGWSWLSVTREFRMAYDEQDKRIDGTFIEAYPTGRFGKIDGEYPIVRWSPNAEFNLSRFGGVVKADANPRNPAEMIFSKGWCAKWVELGVPNSNTEKNIVYLRLADVLLGHAEACNESGQGDPLSGLNAVRDRAGLAPLQAMDKDAMRDAIVAERVKEFAFEQELYPELRRKSTFGGRPDYLGDFIRDYSSRYNMGRQVKARDYVLPIPLKELQGNPNVKQNPVWQ